ncbi:hypothetical protein [Mesorhizobium sp. M0146]|uniref:hypothetical protein n=1 Tax=unclassified Mesorhizobium TaxID=325217 RepID=UPI00333B5018
MLHSWDSIARRYVEHDTTAQETFGPLEMRPRTKDEFPYIRSLIAKQAVEVGAVPAANDNAADQRVINREPSAFTSTTPRADRRNAYITTYTGRFWPFDPQAADVNIEDIAHSLSMQCRYAGHGRAFYSVAEHSVHIARWCMKFGPHTALTGLLHDATEAYLVDVPRPVKAHLTGYKEAEAGVWKAIADKFNLGYVLPSVVHLADGRICADEMSQNLHEVDPNVGPPLGIQIQCWPPGVAEIYFLDTFRKLSAENMRAAA